MTALLAGQQGFESRQKYSQPQHLDSALYLFLPGGISQGVKWKGREADSSLPSSAEVQSVWSYISIPIMFSAWLLIKDRDKFAFYLHITGCMKVRLLCTIWDYHSGSDKDLCLLEFNAM